MLLKLFFGLTLFDVMDAMTGSSYGHGYAADSGYSAPAVVAPSAGYDAHTSSGYSARSGGGYNNEAEEVRRIFFLNRTLFVLDSMCCCFV